jgi:GDP-4-dehydro-6-deoxy-D-mannose reductase
LNKKYRLRDSTTQRTKDTVRAIITGGSGFVAQHLAQHLSNCGDDVLLTRRTNGHDCQFPALNWDLTAPLEPPVERAVEQFKPDTIFHLAAISTRGACGSSEPSAAAVAVNVQGTQHVIDLCESLASKPLLFFTSSVYVYGSRRAVIENVAEHDPPAPDNGYGVSKLLAEQLLRTNDANLQWVIARSFQHSGPGQSGSLLVPDWIGKLQHRPSNITVGNLNTWIDISDVRDVVRAYRLIAQPQFSGQTFNVGSGKATRSGEVMEILQNLIGTQCDIQESQPGTHYLPIANISHITKKTNWKPTISITQMLQDCLE